MTQPIEALRLSPRTTIRPGDVVRVASRLGRRDGFTGVVRAITTGPGGVAVCVWGGRPNHAMNRWVAPERITRRRVRTAVSA